MSGNNIFQMSQELRQQINWLNEILIGDESSVINVNGKIKPSIDKSVSDRFTAISAMVQGRSAYQAKADLPATPAIGIVLAEVWNDPLIGNNGLYGWDGAGWIKSPYDPQLAALTAISLLSGDIDMLKGPGYPGAAEYFETLDDSPQGVFQIKDLSNAIALELWGTESRYDGEYEKIDDVSDDASLLVLDKKGKCIFDASYLAKYDGLFEALEDDSSDSEATFVLVDRNGNRMVPYSPEKKDISNLKLEIAESRGSEETLDERLSKTLNPAGLPYYAAFNSDLLFETNNRLRCLQFNRTRSYRMFLLGDSWTHSRGIWSANVAQHLFSEYGRDDVGWVGFSSWTSNPVTGSDAVNGNIDNDAVKLSYAGIWTSHYKTTASPDLGSVINTQIGDRIVVDVMIDTDSVDLFCIANSNSTIKYSYDGAKWHNKSLSGDGLLITELSPPPPTPFTLTIEAVTTDVCLCGVNLRTNSETGVTVHKAGSSGSNTRDWAQQVISDHWLRGIAHLSPDIITICHGTNDQFASITPNEYQQNIRNMITSIRTVLPDVDMLLMSPAANYSTNHSYKMSDYAAVVADLAITERCAYINLQYAFGHDYDDYAPSSNRDWFSSDGVHPNWKGGMSITDAILRIISK